jgi:hypothetical protein
MESYNKDISTTPAPAEPSNDRHRSGRVLGGLIIVAVGAMLLAREAGADIPRWVFSFPTLLIALGIYIGTRHRFKGFAWLIPIAIGGVMLADRLNPYMDIPLWPMIIIGVGLFMIFRSGKKNNDPYWRKWDSENSSHNSGDDYIDSVVVFGGVKKNIISKTFKGGEAVTVFGGTEINMTQADVDGKIVLELTQIFGGTKVIIPPHWRLQTDELVAIFGGVEDKRPILSDPSSVSNSKILVLKGNCIFGGIDIKSY